MSLNRCKYLVVAILLIHFVQCFHPTERLSTAIAQSELDEFPWSTGVVRLVRGRHMYIYHNYTPSETADKTHFGAWLHREVIPHHERVIGSRSFDGLLDHFFDKRGFIANPDVPQAEALAIPMDTNRYVTWNWMRDPNLRCKNFIPICFADEAAKMVFLPHAKTAMDMWHQALGDQRGVELTLTRGDAQTGVADNLCDDRYGNWGTYIPRDTVVIKLRQQEGGSYNGVGWKPLRRMGRDNGRMVITAGPWKHGDPNDDDNTIQMLAHEMGHELGLEHEHQRPDAGKYIEIFPENFLGMEKLDTALAEYNKAKGLALKKADVIDSYYWMARIRCLLGDRAPALSKILPIPPSNDKWEVSDAKMDGPFDFDSIMIYSSWSWSLDFQHPTMLKRDQGGSVGRRDWELPEKISSGDVKAVKRIYPDIVSGP